jgi:hypothetical protein
LGIAVPGPKVPEGQKDEVYKEQQKEITRKQLEREAEKRQQENNRGGR